MAWRVARALETLLAQINASHPTRSRASDGSIGNAAHASRSSDHNPWLVLSGQGVVTARDFTHDPGAGFDSYAFADALLRAQDPRLKYVISNGRIGSGPAGPKPGVWRPYSGANHHDHHVHVSVVGSSRCDDTAPWSVGLAAVTVGVPAPAAPAPSAPAAPAPQVERCDPAWQRKLNALGFDAGPDDGIRGDRTKLATRAFQTAAFGPGDDVDGIEGPRSWEKANRVPDYRSDARAFQQRLKDRGWRIVVDNDWGPGSTKVLRAFQAEKRGLSADGIRGPQSWTALWTRDL